MKAVVLWKAVVLELLLLNDRRMGGREVTPRHLHLNTNMIRITIKQSINESIYKRFQPKYNNVKIVISEVYASFVLQFTVSGR